MSTTTTEPAAEPTPTVPVQRSATVGVQDTTIGSIQNAATLVGAPADAAVYTNTGVIVDDSGQRAPHHITFTWLESK